MKNVDNMAKLVGLNEYMDELEIGLQRNLINTKPILDNHDLLNKVEVVSKPLLVSIKYTFQFRICSLSTSSRINPLPQSLVLNPSSNNVFYSNTGPLLSAQRQVPALPALVQVPRPWKLPEKEDSLPLTRSCQVDFSSNQESQIAHQREKALAKTIEGF